MTLDQLKDLKRRLAELRRFLYRRYEYFRNRGQRTTFT